MRKENLFVILLLALSLGLVTMVAVSGGPDNGESIELHGAERSEQAVRSDD